MEWLAPGLLVAQIVGLGALVWIGGRRLKTPAAPAPALEWPAVSVIIPVKGLSRAAREGIDSLTAQGYPDIEFLFVTESEGDEATPLIREVLGRVRGRHIVAGPAASCGQKNFNLLAGIRASDPGRPVLVFCDAGHSAPPDWLRELVAPIAARKSEVSTGYHFVDPSPPAIPSAGRAATVLMLHVLQQIPGLAQPWGGASAMTRALFERLNLAEFWARQVVDDVSLALLLKKQSVRVVPAPAAVMRTVLESESWAEWYRWLTRQLFYLKMYFPFAWFVGGLLGYAMAVFLLICPFSAMGPAPWALLLLLIVGMRSFHPSPGPWGRWLAGGVAAIVLACIGHARTVFMRGLTWRGIVYEVARDGSVRRI
ncbi:MAG TPA: glycosyltransferase family 2 protein [Kiritimatiellia bacterium]|nr:glycosyltransferase family 2 protein [Kiritimatiellia bacterium]HSA17443.1 glycosyltransferase family 2 protein [Kiritimatiellia bacterium]